MHIQAAVEDCLFSSDVTAKLAAMAQLEELITLGHPVGAFTGDLRPTHDVRFPVRPEWVSPRQLKRRSMTDPEGLKVFLHAVAHIEFVAIHLALDAAYRYREVPDTFRRDWLGVAVEETRHFKSVVVRMAEISAEYGDYPAHGGLWELAESTASDLAARMALIPRFMEARGLDVTPGMIEKFQRIGDHRTVDVLSLIFREEIGHVALGSQWYLWAAKSRHADPEKLYFDLIGEYLSGEVRGPFNEEARLEAGFTQAELNQLITLSQIKPQTAPVIDSVAE